MSIFNRHIWSRWSTAPTYPSRSYYQRTPNKERRCQDWDKRCRSLREGEDWEERGRGRKKTVFKRPISKRLRAVLLRSFKKMVCVRGVPGVTGTFEKANSHFGPTQTGLMTAPLR